MIHGKAEDFAGDQVEFIESEKGVTNTISTGSVLGELSSILGVTSIGTFSAASYVKAIEIPCQLYVEFVKRNSLFNSITRISNNSQFLRNSWLFGEMTSYPILNRIVQSMNSCNFSQDQVLPKGSTPHLFLLEKGELEIYVDTDVVDVLTEGGFFGE